MGALTAPVPVPSFRAAWMVSAAAMTQVALASWTATGWMSIPTTFSWSFLRVSVAESPSAWLRILSTAVSMKVPLPAGGVHHPLVEWVVDHLLRDFLRQPAGGVVLAQPFAFLLGDHVLVEGGRYLLRILGPVKLFRNAGDFAEVCAFPHLGGPCEEVGVNDAVQVGLFGQDAPLLAERLASLRRVGILRPAVAAA